MKKLILLFFLAAPFFALADTGVTEDTVDNMRQLIGVADVIVPNLTEAQFLTGLYEGEEQLTEAQARQVVDALRAFGPRSVIITSGQDAETGKHMVWGYDHKKDAYFNIPYRLIRVHFPGTGDMFSAVLVGNPMRTSSISAFSISPL